MPNYRGGERSFSNYGLEAMKAIKDGSTERQIERDQRNKILLGVAQAGLTGIAGAVKAEYSEAPKRDLAQKKYTMQKAIANAKAARDSQYANSPVQDYVPMQDGPDDGQVPWARDVGGDAVSPNNVGFQDMAKSAMDDAVAKGREAQKVNSAASAAPVNGTYTRSGLDALNQEAQTGAEDLNTSKRLLGVGGGTGLGGSMKTWGDDL